MLALVQPNLDKLDLLEVQMGDNSGRLARIRRARKGVEFYNLLPCWIVVEIRSEILVKRGCLTAEGGSLNPPSASGC